MSKRKMKASGGEWLGEIPAEWGVMRLRFLVDITTGNRDTQDADPEGEYPFYVRSPIVQRCNGYTFEGPGIMMAGDGAGAGRIFHLATGRYAVHQRVYRLYDFKGIDKTFLWYYLGVSFPNEMDKGSAQSTVPSVRLPMMQNLPAVVPALPVQRKIAEYLDARCAKIDEMISDAKKTIEEYKAWKSSVIFEAVTGKCKIENGECKIGGWAMRESGVEWIGMIPEGWRVNRVKRIVRVENGSDPLTEGSIPVYGSGESSFKTCGEFKEGPTVLLGRKGATLHIPHYIEGRYWNVDTAFDVRMKGNDNLRWFYYLAISFDYKAYISKTTLPSMTQSNYNNMHVPHPPVTEQCAIAAFLDKKCAAIDRVIAEKESLIADLESYKKSLIFECVTGKMEVA